MTTTTARAARQKMLMKFVHFASQQWKLEPPSLIISVTGDAESITIRPAYYRKFTRVQPQTRVLVCAARSLNPTGRSRVTLSARKEHLRAACGPTTGGKGS